MASLGNPLKAAAGLARITAGAYVRGVEWGVQTGVRTGARVLRAASTGESAGELLAEFGRDARQQARHVLGVVDVEERVRAAARAAQAAGAAASAVSTSAASATADAAKTAAAAEQVAAVQPNGSSSPNPGGNGRTASPATESALRKQGSLLLRQSADVAYEEVAHPAYERILSELAPDEARILRFFVADGPQPAVDVRTGRPLNVGSQLVAPGLTMIGAKAGIRFGDRLPAYLNNLYRLGLVWFSREAIEPTTAYQVLEAQPEVTEAMKRAGRGRTIRRSIHLTPFGEDFCKVCLPL